MSEEREVRRRQLRRRWRALSALLGFGIGVGALLLWVLLPRAPMAPLPPGTGAPGTPPLTTAAAPDTTRPPVQIGRTGGSVIAAFEASVDRRLAAGPVPTEPIRRGIRVRAGDVLWRDREDRPFLRLASATATLNAIAVQRGRYELDGVVLNDPRVLLVQTDTGAVWNYVPVLGFDQPAAPPSGPGNPNQGIFLNGIRVVGGDVEIRRPAQTYVARDLHGTIASVAVPSGDNAATVAIERMLSTFTIPADSVALPLEIAGAHLTLPGGEVDFRIERVQLAQSVVENVQGVFDSDFGGYGIRATGRAAHVELADVTFMGPKVPDEGTASFDWAVAPEEGATAVELTSLELHSGESEVTGSVALAVPDTGGFALRSVDARLSPVRVAFLNRFLENPLPYTGELRGSIKGPADALSFDVAATLAPEGERRTFTTQLNGRIGLGGTGVRLGQLEATLNEVPLASLRPYLPNVHLAGALSGTIALTGAPGTSPLDVNVRLETAGGVAIVTGTVDLTGAEPAYDLSGRLLGVDIQQLAEPKMPPVTLTAEFKVSGHGTDPATLAATAGLDGRFSGWYTNAGDEIHLQASADSGMLHVARLAAAMGPVALNANGDWGLRDDVVSPGIEFRLNVSALGPLGPYLPAIENPAASGSIDVSGTAKGTLQHPQIAGDLRLQDVRYGPWGVGAAEGTAMVALGDSLPTLHVSLGARAVQTPTAGAFQAASVEANLAPPSFDLDARANRVGGGVIEITADGTLLEAGVRAANVTHFVADLGNERWSLQRPAKIQWGGVPGIVVHDLAVATADSTGRLSLDGTLYPLNQADFRFDVAALPTGRLQQMLGQDSIITGDLWANGTVVGGGTPRVDATLRLDSGEVRGVRYTQIQGQLGYADRVATLAATGDFRPAGRIDLKATVPVDVELTDSLRASLIDDGRLDGRLTTRAFPLRTLDPLFPMFRELGGTTTADVTLGGTPGSPELAGDVLLDSGAVTLPALDRRFTSIAGHLALSGQKVVVDSLRLESGGSATATGQVTFQELSSPVADLKVRLNDFRPMGVANYQPAAMSGDVTVRGTLPDVTLSGSVRVADGNFEIPQVGGDPFQQQVEQFMETGGVATAGLEEGAASTLFDHVSIQGLTVVTGDNVWFILQQPEARIQLSGELTLFVTKNAVKIFGTLSGQHGTFTMQAGPLIRRFDVTDATIRFFGSPDPNPALQITASRVVYTGQSNRVNVLVNVSGTARNPSLSLSTAEGTEIPESELLSFLLFGRSSANVGAGFSGGGGLQESLVASTLLGGVGDILSSTAEQALARELGVSLDYLQFRFEEATCPTSFLGCATVEFGKEIANNFFITVNAGLSGLFGTSAANGGVGVAVEWRIDPEWTVGAGVEPLIRRRYNLLGLEIVSPLTNPGLQKYIDLRRRWTY